MSVHLSDGSWAFYLAVVSAGFVGSIHCAGMCGPLILGFAARRSQLWSYHLARTFSYSLVGGLAGSFGYDLRAYAPNWVQAVLFLFLSAVLLLKALGLLRGQERPQSRSRFSFDQLYRTAARSIFRKSSQTPISAAFTAGLISVLLPCGHLYLFIASAASTGSFAAGAITMLLFSASTLPVLAGAMRFAQIYLRPLAQRRVTGLLLIVAALLSLGGFATVAVTHSSTTIESPRCH